MSEIVRRVVVVGASSGIGDAAARRFAREGWLVYAVARRRELLERLAAELDPDRCKIVVGDYSKDETIDRLVETVHGDGGLLDALVNSAGISQAVDLLDTPWNQWRAAMDIMIDGAVKLTRAAVPLMPLGGRIVHITSIHAERAERGASSYGMAKAAIEQYCRAAALELADRGILVNAIAPGFIDTPMSSASGVNELETEWFKNNYVDGHHLPLRRAGRPEEVAGVAWFLAGPDASYITGHTLTVDGGLSITF
jgi:3-oxoacyl-[acyl-carrier protein] reductase